MTKECHHRFLLISPERCVRSIRSHRIRDLRPRLHRIFDQRVHTDVIWAVDHESEEIGSIGCTVPEISRDNDDDTLWSLSLEGKVVERRATYHRKALSPLYKNTIHRMLQI